MGDNNTHMKPDEVNLTQEMVNAVQILIKKTEYNISLGDNHRRTIEWELTEAELYEHAKKIIKLEKE